MRGEASWYLGDISGPREAEGDGSNGSGHEPHGNLVATVPDSLDGLADIPVVVSHANVLGTTERR